MAISVYQKHLKDQYQETTFKRKVDYLKYNFSDIFNKLDNSCSVLEIGPGVGECISYLNDLGIKNIDIVDSDKNILKSISHNFKINKSFHNENISLIDKKLKKYDLIILIQVLEHMPIKILPEVLKVLFFHLNNNGQIIIVVPNVGNPLGLVERYGDLQHTIAFTERSLKDLVEVSGVKNYELKLAGYKIPPFGIVNITRVFLQQILHYILLAIMVINGGTYFKILTPNIVLSIKKTLDR